MTDPCRNPEARARALELYAAGVKLVAISAEVGAHVSQVRRWAAKAGLPKREPLNCPPKWKKQWTAKALEMKRKGATWREIAERFGVTQMVPFRHVTRAIREGRVRA